jgi:diguanylate cyclase
MRHLSDEQLQTAIVQLDQAMYNHDQWHRNLLRVLVSRLPPDAADLMSDAHRRCRFGQWYESDAAGFMRELPAFVALGEAHAQMHQGAAGLLQRVADDLPVSPSGVDQFNNVLDRMRLELQSLRHELADTAQNRDPLTGVRNRASLLSDLREQHAMVRRGVQACALAMVDLDHFKEINDRHGHPAGDTLLRAISEALQAQVRPYDRIYRNGGEEFLLCLPQTTIDDAVGIVDRLRVAIGALQVDPGGGGSVLQITASFGVAAVNAELSVEESIDRADKALYQAKAAGRNRVEVAD